MKSRISADMEGPAGVSHPGPTGRGDPGHPAAVEVVVREPNAAIQCTNTARRDRLAGRPRIRREDAVSGSPAAQPPRPCRPRAGDR
jgi:hypothetical protein